MENVQFGESQQMNSLDRSPKLSAITRFFIKIHLAKDQKSANSAMVAVAVLCLIAIIYFMYRAISLGLFR